MNDRYQNSLFQTLPYDCPTPDRQDKHGGRRDTGNHQDFKTYRMRQLSAQLSGKRDDKLTECLLWYLVETDPGAYGEDFYSMVRDFMMAPEQLHEAMKGLPSDIRAAQTYAALNAMRPDLQKPETLVWELGLILRCEISKSAQAIWVCRLSSLLMEPQQKKRRYRNLSNWG